MKRAALASDPEPPSGEPARSARADDEEGARRRALSDARDDATWPPAVGDRVHYNTGWPHNSWTGVVRAVVDGRIAVVLRSAPDGGGGRDYVIVDRFYFEPHFAGRCALRRGAIPAGVFRRA